MDRRAGFNHSGNSNYACHWPKLQRTFLSQAKLVYLFEKDTSIIKKFDTMEGGDQAVDHDYVFDPTNRLTTKDCDTDGQCESAWSKN